MAPSLPGTSGRRNASRGSRSSPAASVKREGSYKREARSSRATDKQDSDSEDQRKRSSSPTRSKRPARKAVSQSKQRHSQQQDTEDMKDDHEDEDQDEVASVKDELSEPPEDLEEKEGEVDETGETKITKDGELLGGRQYKCRSFKLPTRGDRIYMLSMDPARVLGFRDSYLFFLKNPQLVRVNTTMEERQWMIENGMLMANFKSKLIAVVTARSIFKSFGARIIKSGRSRIDDYYESKPTDEDILNESEGDATSRTGEGNTGSGSINGGSFHQDEDAPSGSSRRKRTLTHDEAPRHITGLNWMYESAMAVRALNARLKELRKENPKFLDPHTNIEQAPLSLQPTRCEVQAVSEPVSTIKNAAEITSLATAETQNAVGNEPSVFSTPRSIGPQVEAAIKVPIKPNAPLPPQIHDPSVWAAIPDEIRQVLQEEEVTRINEEECYEDVTKHPIAIVSGQYQAAFPM
ncbi:hypothetical protein BGX28_009906 [Mortierella sp. GBA30]|nr:hypothetical protein BGX28_009906 [Mortierella sp. GBA30]